MRHPAGIRKPVPVVVSNKDMHKQDIRVHRDRIGEPAVNRSTYGFPHRFIHTADQGFRHLAFEFIQNDRKGAGDEFPPVRIIASPYRREHLIYRVAQGLPDGSVIQPARCKIGLSGELAG
ncbi:hypothetical protein D3C73_1207790 [compost metagenome]